MSIGSEDYSFLPDLVLRTPYYSFLKYDLERLPDLLHEQVFRNALWLASPVFYRSLEKAGFAYGRLTERQKHTLAKYYNRMCFRPVPFGSFAGVSCLRWSDGSTVRLSADGSLLHLLPDGDYGRQERSGTGRGPSFCLNPMLYRLGKEYRLIYSLPDDKGKYRYELRSFPAERFYRRLFRLLDKGPVAYGDLLAWLTRTTGNSREDAGAFLSFLLDQQIVFGNDRGDVLAGPGIPPGRLTVSPAVASVAGTGNYYAGLTRPVISGGPGSWDQQELLTAVRLLYALLPSGKGSALDGFKKDFHERFGERRVPLLQALDPDAGIGYGAGLEESGADLLKDMDFREMPDAANSMTWTTAHHLLLQLWPREARGVLVLTEAQVRQAGLGDDAGQLPAVATVMFRQAGDLLLLDSAGGVSGLPLVGRFSMFDEGIENLCRELAALEAASGPDCLFADIGQLSDVHVDNINRRKAALSYEIPLNVYGALPGGTWLLPADLYLRLAGEELLLETGSGKRVIPRLSTAYNYHRNELPLFRLLCDLQGEGLRMPRTFRLSNFFPGLSRYPRVQAGRTVFSLASWSFRAVELEHLFKGDLRERLERLRVFRQEHGLPALISLGDTDQQLVFDLSDAHEGLFFLEEVQGQSRITIYEYLAPAKYIKCGNGPVAGQYVAFLNREGIVYTGKPQGRDGRGVQRSFVPGSEWLYVQLYCTPAAADRILAAVVRPFIRAQRRQVRTWFFIRYLEGGYHLRLRLELYDPADVGKLLVGFQRRMEAGGYSDWIRHWQTDTYDRELERYGPSIEQIERLFETGSALVCEWLTLGEAADLPEFSMGLQTAFRLCAVWLSNDTERAAFTATVESSLSGEFGDSKALRMALDSKYRGSTAQLWQVADMPLHGLPGDLGKLFSQLLEVAAALASDAGGKDTRLLADVIHMQLNRTFRRDARRHELLVYGCLSRYYRSVLSRSKRLSTETTAGEQPPIHFFTEGRAEGSADG